VLVIRRRVGESLLIGEDVEVQVLDICGAQIKIGIQAPREIVILRSEVRLAAEANRLAARYTHPSLLTSLAKKFANSAQDATTLPDKDN